MSHDQDFLNNVVTDIVHLQERKLLYYKGNYEHFKHVSQQAFADRVKKYEKQQKKLRELKRKNTSGKRNFIFYLFFNIKYLTVIDFFLKKFFYSFSLTTDQVKKVMLKIKLLKKQERKGPKL